MLPTLPDELRGCKNLRHIALVYTHMETVPSWTKEFTKLEFLHIEAALDIASLTSLPDDLFDNMDSLSFLQLAVHQHLPRLPSFQGLVNLRSLALALLLELEELPDFASLTKLELLVMPLLIGLDSVPDMSPVRNLQGFVLTFGRKVCCNGFLDNQCDASNPACYLDSSWESPPVTCLPTNRTDKIASEATRRLFASFPYSVCTVAIPPAIKQDEYPQEADVESCNGTLYRQCQLAGNRTGMCYSMRMMPIACIIDPFPIKMRKRQIAESVGDKCDPEYEAWLGCPSSGTKS
ncbi:hypothetical protein Gpo141_00012002 [Globisporangium polare]